jgi:hypothetical protein
MLSTLDLEVIEVALVAEVVGTGRGSGRRHLSGRGRGGFSTNH